MAKDDLSVNINVGVNLDKASVDNANEQIEKLEANIDRLNAKSARVDLKTEFQKELGFGSGVKVQVGGYSTGSMKSKAKAESAQAANEFAQELSQMLGLEFINEFAKSVGKKDFKVPTAFALKAGPAGSEAYEKALKQATEDFIVTSANNVVISPDMALAALERVIAKNPNAYMAGNLPGRISGVIKPTPAFGETANFDQVVTNQFNNFLDNAIGGNDQAAQRVSQFLESKLKVLFSKIIDEGQKARERTFTSARVSEGDDAAEGLVRYADDAARKAIAMAEQRFGLQAGSTALYAPGMVPEKFRSKPEATSDPQALLNVLIGEYQDEVTGALMASLPDPSKVANPIAQVLMNPYILGDKFATGYEQEVGKLLKSKAATTAATVAPVTEPAKGGALNPNIEMLRKYLTEQKALVEAEGKTFMAGLDTEFNSQIEEKLTELGIVIKDGTGKFVEIFKFLQLPGDLQALEAGGRMLPPGSVKNAKDLFSRGEMLGIPKESIGVPEDASANFMQYRDKILKLVEIVNLLGELGIQLTGSNFQGAEVSNIRKAIEYINSQSASRGLDPIGMPDFSNVFDPAKIAQKLSGGSAELAKIFDSPEAKKGISGALGHLIRNIAEQFPDFMARYSDQFKMAESGGFQFKVSGGMAPAHYAVSDAAASLIVKDFIEEMGDTAATLLIPVAKDLNTKVQAASGGSGGNKPPSRGTGAGDKSEDQLEGRAAQSLQRALLVEKQYEQAVSQLTAQERAKVEQRLVLLRSSSSQADILTKLAEKELEYANIRREMADVSQGSMSFISQQRRGLQGPLTRDASEFVESGGAQRYEAQAKAAAKLKNEILELTSQGQKYELQVISEVKEQARQGQVTEQLTDNLRKQIDIKIQDTQAGKTATASIKAQMRDQVAAQREVQKQTQSLMNTWVTSRYALYDIGNFYQNVAQNLIRVSRQIFDTTQSYRRFETSFTSVERAMQLTGSAALDMRNQFVLLSETIPVAFEDIARIGTLGAQMGIASDGIIGFTETVSKFASITGISAETVAQQFGRIAELADVDPTQFNNLGSAVAFAGVNAVATEAEILNLTQSIAAVSNQAGITAPEIVGIATALASVGIASEQARGVFTRVFADIDRAATTGGKSLQALSEVTGLSAETISSSWGKEGAANEVFIALLRGLDSADNLTEAFDKLNIVETREINTLTRLAKNLDVVQQALSDSNLSFEDATFLGDSFERTVDNLDSKITLFKNNLDSLAAALSSGFALALGGILDAGSEFLKFLKGAEDSILFTTVLPFGAVITALGAGLAGFAAVAAKVTAQLYAFRVAMINAANNPTVVSGIVGQTKALLGLGSGLIEVRDQVSGINERGLIEPVNFSNLFNVKAQQAELLKTRNIYMSMGKVAEEAMGKEAAKSLTSVQLARQEADAVNQLVLAKRLEIETLENSQNPAEIAEGARLRTAGSQLHVFAIEGEIVALNQLQLEEYQSYIASSTMTEAKKKEALARSQNATVINLETKAAAGGIGAIGKFASRALGLIGIVGSVVIAIDMLVKAFENVNKVDLTESGGGLESLREAIKKDTLAVRKGTMDAVATAQVEYKVYRSEVDKSAQAIAQITGVNDSVAKSFNKVTEEVKTQTVALGANTKEWLANAIFNNPELKKWRKEDPLALDRIQSTMASLGITFDGVIQDFVAAADGANINPLEDLEETLNRLKTERRELILAQKPGTWNNAAAGSGARVLDLNQEINDLEQAKALLKSIGVTIQSVFSDTSVWNSIKEALGLKDANNDITKLIDRYRKVVQEGKKIKPVMNDIKAAVIGMLSEADKTDEALTFQINSEATLSGLIAIIDGLIKTKEAAFLASGALDKVGTSAFWSASFQAAFEEKAGTAKLKEIFKSLQALAAGAAVEVDNLGGASESAADRIARLISEANKGVTGIMNFREAIRALGKSMAENKGFNLNTVAGAANTQSVLSVLDTIGTRAGNSTKRAINNMKVFKLVLQDMGAPQAAIKLVNNAIKALGGVAGITAKQARNLRREFANLFKTFETNFSAGAAEVVEDVEKKVRSLTDYVNDLQSVLQAAFDFRYARTVTLDAITTSWIGIQEAAKSAEDAIKSANAEINESFANRAVLEYQLSVAERYNDEKRAAVIRAKLAKLDEEIIDKQKQLADANEQNDKSLNGNTKAAINNRAKVRDLVTQYNAYLIALANSGASSETLQSEAAKLEQEFLSQGIAMGFAENELASYTAAFKGDFTKVINGVPKDITVNVNTDPALRAIEEFVAKAKESLSSISSGITINEPDVPVASPGFSGSRPGPEKDGTFVGQIGPQGGFIWDGVKWVSRKEANRAVGTAGPNNPGKFVGQIGPQGGYIWDGQYWLKRAQGGLITGGGSQTSDSIPTMLSNGEYVIRASAVSSYGLDFMNALNQQRVGFAPAQGSFNGSSSGSSVVYLSPEDRALLRAAVDRPIALYTENTKIAQSANAGNMVLAQRGSN